MKRTLAIVALALLACGFFRPARAGEVDVAGTSCPWLAGMPATATACPGDSAPALSPVPVDGLGLVAGDTLRFTATGSVGNGPPPTVANDPDGGFVLPIVCAINKNGMSNVFAPINSLIGVFLGPARPDLSPLPPELDFSDPASRDYVALHPELKQVFFIGKGFSNEGIPRGVLIPAGATRLFLGTMDGGEWSNNVGSFQVLVGDVPTPTRFSSWGALKLFYR